MLYFQKGGFSDWSASAAFYTLYHLLLAILAREGYESRNQSCTFALIEELINNEKIDLNNSDLKEIFDKDVTENLEYSDKILDLRERWQYSAKTVMEDEEFIAMKERIKYLFDKLRREVEKI